jgi:hypothetical protein
MPIPVVQEESRTVTIRLVAPACLIMGRLEVATTNESQQGKGTG